MTKAWFWLKFLAIIRRGHHHECWLIGENVWRTHWGRIQLQWISLSYVWLLVVLSRCFSPCVVGTPTFTVEITCTKIWLRTERWFYRSNENVNGTFDISNERANGTFDMSNENGNGWYWSFLDHVWFGFFSLDSDSIVMRRIDLCIISLRIVRVRQPSVCLGRH